MGDFAFVRSCYLVNSRISHFFCSCATKRKKKKPTTFIPPTTLLSSLQSTADQSNGLMSIPFWRRPLPRSQTGGSSENEGSAGSRVNIHQKLQEKKQKQLAELKIIEEEIKQGKWEKLMPLLSFARYFCLPLIFR